MADESQSTAKALLPHAAHSNDSVPALNKVGAIFFPNAHHVLANAPKMTTNDATTADILGESEAPNSAERSCPLFKLSTELRLEICRVAIQHALDLVNPPPNTNSRCSAAQTTRGALALLYTCRTLRAESIDAMEPLAKASKCALQSEINLARSRYLTTVEAMSDFESKFAAFLTLECELHPMQSKMTEIDEVCSVLAFAREADEKIRAGERMGGAREKITAENGQCVIWGSK